MNPKHPKVESIRNPTLFPMENLEEAGKLTAEQATDLEHLQRLADARVSLLKPRQAEAIDQQIEKLKRQGLWTE